MGGNISTRYTGLYPEKVRKLVSIEGLGPSPAVQEERTKTPFDERMRQWIADKRQAAGRQPRRYATLDEALARMMTENAYLTEEQARHLTIQGASRNEDGSWSWKFDNYLNIWTIFDMPQEELHKLWANITCPTLLLYGADSWASNPEKDGRIQYFKTAQVIEFENAGHWLHHDQFDRFMSTLDTFL
jgi:pimeloyl-ACP methyl ester carboxylesterase